MLHTKLRKKYIDDLRHSIESDFSRVAINDYHNFTFTVDSVECGAAQFNGATVAFASERHMFKRVDNKNKE